MLPKIIAAVVVLGLLIYFLNFTPKNREKKRNILTRFRQLRERSQNLQSALTHDIMANDSSNKQFANGQTYGQVLKQLKKNHFSHLSEKKFAQLRGKYNTFTLNNVNKMLDKQEAMLYEMENKYEASKN